MFQAGFPSRRGPGFITGILFMLLGIFILALGVGLIPINPSDLHAPIWLVAIFGGMFLLVGIWVVFLRAVSQNTPQANWINVLFGLVVMLSTSIISLWIGFGPGPRAFVQYEPTSVRPTALLTNPTLGRVLFGGFGVLMSIMTITFVFIQFKKLLGRTGDH